VALKVDVIVASSNPAIGALKSRTRTIPIVMAVVGDPVGAGFIASLSRPGGNITGLSNLAEGLSAKRLEILMELNPRMSRIAVLRNSAIPTHADLYRETEVAARTMRVTLVPVDFRGAEDFESAFRTMARHRVDAFISLPDPVTTGQRAKIVNLAAKHRLAGIYSFAVFVESGGLAAYGPSYTDLWRRSAGYVDRILKGARPADLPVEQPTKFELVINMKTARALGITIPQSILVRADRVIE
jgi:putative ABC transport system substrate-binding protein